MPQGRDEAGNIWEVDARGNAVRLISAAGQGPQMPADPTYPTKGPKAEADLAHTQNEERRAQQEFQRKTVEWNATHHPDGSPKDPMENAIPANLEGVTGDAFLKTLSSRDAAQVKALAEGRMQFPQGRAATSPYWQTKIAQVSQYDPSFDAINYNARSATRRDFTAGKAANNIRALNTAIGHLGHLADQISGTASHGGFPGATTLNKAQNLFQRSSGDSGVTQFEQTAGALAGELTQVYRASGGAEADIQRYLGELDVNGSAEQKKAAVANIMSLLQSRLDALADQYDKGMGVAAGGLQPLDDRSKEALTKYLPGFDPTQYGGTPGGGSGGGGNPVIGGPGLAGGGEGEKSLPIPQEMQAKHAAYLAQHWGRIDPNDYANFRAQLDSEYGFAPRMDAYRAIVPDLNARAQQGGTPGGLNIPPVNAQMNGLDKFNATVFNNPLGAAVLGAGSLGGGADELVGTLKAPFTGRSVVDEITRANAIRQAAASQYPGATMAGNIGGTIGLAAATGGAGLLADSPILAGAGYGAANGALENNDSRLGGAIGGGLAGTAGGAAGKYLLAPGAKALMDTRAGQTVSRGGRKLYNGLFGNKMGLPAVAPEPLVPSFQPGERALPGSAGLSAAQANMQEASGFGLPYSLADADPKLRMLAGSVARKSPNARDLAEQTFDPRALGQADRAVSAIDTHLAPITNIEQRGSDLLAAGNQASGPSYSLARSRPAPVDPQINAMLDTPAGREALDHAHTLAANEGRDPNALGFDLNDQGEVVLREMPSFETLQYVKRGLDSVVEGKRNPLTGQLDLHGDPLTGAVNNLRSRFNARLGELNPDYAAANAEYAKFAQRKDALNLGYKTLPNNGVPYRQFESGVASLNGETLPEAQMGYATNMADTVDRARLSTNPYDSVYGSPLQQQKVGAMFPQGSPKFGRIYDFEKDMAKTRNETLGGSPTASRTAADQMFDSPAGLALDSAIQLKTGGGVSPAAITKFGLKALGDSYKLGLGKKRADALAPVLFNTNPDQVIGYLESLAARKAQDEARKKAFQRGGGMFGAVAFPSAVMPSGGY